MSMKRTSTEFSNDGQTTEGSDSVLDQHEDTTRPKRAKLDSLSDTTLQDLPIELLQCILVKAVAMEVKGMKLAKSVWKAKADLVISRLRTVCSQWNSILTTNFFRNELHRTLDNTAQETIRLEMLHQPSIASYVLQLAALKDEVFMLCGLQPVGTGLGIYVYDRDNMVEAKAVIPLTEISYPEDMAACSVSNCVYLLNKERHGSAIFRITKDEHQFRISAWIKNVRLPIYDRGPISVSPNGSLIILARQRSPKPTLVGIYNADGSVQDKIRLSPATYGFRYVSRVSQKSNGNLVGIMFPDHGYEAKLMEIDTSGRVIHEYQLSGAFGVLSFVDIYDRILIARDENRIEVLDSEFNPLNIVVSWQVEEPQLFSYLMHYNSERNEMVGIDYDSNTDTTVLAIFPITEE